MQALPHSWQSLPLFHLINKFIYLLKEEEQLGQELGILESSSPFHDTAISIVRRTNVVQTGKVLSLKLWAHTKVSGVPTSGWHISRVREISERNKSSKKQPSI